MINAESILGSNFVSVKLTALLDVSVISDFALYSISNQSWHYGSLHHFERKDGINFGTAIADTCLDEYVLLLLPPPEGHIVKRRDETITYVSAFRMMALRSLRIIPILRRNIVQR